jgi:plasmid maintenance system antidote protein VapI
MGNRTASLRRAFVKAVEDEMTKQQLSERGLSETVGKHKNFINDVIHGQHVVKLDEFIEISEALGVHPLDMLSRLLRP